VVLARRVLGARPQASPVAALGLAALPILLNWRAANRRPDSLIAPTLGEALLLSSPPNAMLFVAGDNDSYTTWYRQSVLDERRDVVPVTISLLPATWYRQELARRHRLLDSATVASWQGEEATLRALVKGAREQGRPVAAAVTMPNAVRMQLAAGWTLGGMAYVADAESTPRGDLVDSTSTRRVADLITARLAGTSGARDPTTAYVARLLRCPEQALRLGSTGPEASPEGQLDSRCNFK